MNVPSPADSLDYWLGWLESLHPTEIDMGLERVGRVADRLGLRPSTMPLILVGGTNGKGSTVALLDQIYGQANYKVGSYTSPHIDVFNERMCVGGEMLDDQSIVNALYEVESARMPDTLTYFEYTTLAAMVAFVHKQCDVAIMEVGLGGRLDATNLWDADCAILTSIALDHQDYLGDTLEAIAAEKVAIGRRGKPLILGQKNPPDNLLAIASSSNMDLVQIQDDAILPSSALAGSHQQRNAACALLAIDKLQDRLPVDSSSIERGLANVRIAGRFEQHSIDGQKVVFDVAHNPAAAQTVHDALLTYYPAHKVFVVFSALQDKDISGIASTLAPAVTQWFCAGLPVPRAMNAEALSELVLSAQNKPVDCHDSVTQAWQAALQAAAKAEQSVVLVAGSFYTLGQLSKARAHAMDTTS